MAQLGDPKGALHLAFTCSMAGFVKCRLKQVCLRLWAGSRPLNLPDQRSEGFDYFK